MAKSLFKVVGRIGMVGIILFHLGHFSVLAETASNTNGSTGTSLSSGMPPAPTVTQADQPANPTSDRKNSNAASKSLAMAGAAMAMMSCVQLMKAAQKEKDSTTKVLLNSMAMQQCSQGMTDMANAAKSDNNANQLSQSDSPKMAQLQTSPLQDPTKNQADNSVAQTPTTASTTTPDSATPAYPLAEPSMPNRQAPSDFGNLAVAQNNQPDLGTTDLKPTESDKLKFDDTAKTDGNPLGTGTGTLTPASFFGQGIKAPSVDDFKKIAANSDAAKAKRGNGSSAGSGEGESSDDNSSSVGGSKGMVSSEESGMQTLFGQMFGAAAPGDATAGVSSGMQMALLGDPGASGDKPTSNIFQYATYRYRILANQEDRIHLGGGKVAGAVASGSTAHPSREPASTPSASLPDNSAVDQAIAQVLSSTGSRHSETHSE